MHLTLVDGVLAAALSAEGKIAHKGIADAAKSTSIGAGALTLKADNRTAFRMNTPRRQLERGRDHRRHRARRQVLGRDGGVCAFRPST